MCVGTEGPFSDPVYEEKKQFFFGFFFCITGFWGNPRNLTHLSRVGGGGSMREERARVRSQPLSLSLSVSHFSSLPQRQLCAGRRTRR